MAFYPPGAPSGGAATDQTARDAAAAAQATANAAMPNTDTALGVRLATPAGIANTVTAVIAGGILPWVTAFAGADLQAKFAAAVASGRTFYVPAGLGAIATTDRTLAAGQCVYGAGSSSGTWLVAAANQTAMLRAGTGSRIVDLELRGNFTFGALGNGTMVKNNDGGVYCVYIRNVSDVQVLRCKCTGYGTAGIYVAAILDVAGTPTGEITRDVLLEGNTCIGLQITTGGYGSSLIGIFSESQYTTPVAYQSDLVIGSYARKYGVFNLTIKGNTVRYGTHPYHITWTRGVHLSGNWAVEGSHRGFSIQGQTEDFEVIGNVAQDNAACGIHVANGPRGGIVKGNIIRGTTSLGTDGTALQVYYGVEDVVVEGNDLDSRFDLYAGAETRAPNFGIRVGQHCKRISVLNNKIRGYKQPVAVYTTVYPTSITSGDANYHHSGVEGVTIRGNECLWLYTQATAAPPKAQFLRNSGIGVLVSKSGAWEDSTNDGLGLIDVLVEGNTVDGYQQPYQWDYVADTSGNPAAKTRLRDYHNVAKNSVTSGLMSFTNGMSSADVISIGTQWDWKTWSGDLTMTSGTYTYSVHVHRFRHLTPTEVECFSLFVLSANTAGAGALRWPLPYTAQTNAVAGGWPVTVDRVGGITHSASYTNVSPRMVAGNAFAELGQAGSAQPWAALGADKLGATASLALAVRYELPAP